MARPARPETWKGRVNTAQREKPKGRGQWADRRAGEGENIEQSTSKTTKSAEVMFCLVEYPIIGYY